MKAKIYNIDERFSGAVETAVQAYNRGDIFVYPTDTIYGFGLNPFKTESLKKLDEIKQRDPSKQYIMLIDEFTSIKAYVELVEKKHEMFLMNLWRAPVSVVLRLNARGRSLFGCETLALRAPDHPFCSALLERIHAPLVSTSVNRANNPPLHTKESILEEFGNEIDLLFVMKMPLEKKSSTVISLTESEPQLLRSGEITFEEILKKYEQ